LDQRDCLNRVRQGRITAAEAKTLYAGVEALLPVAVLVLIAVAFVFVLRRTRLADQRAYSLTRAGRPEDAIECPECGGRGWVIDLWDWLPVLVLGIVGFLLQRRVTCPRCKGTGWI
jgi:hypothetical protein